MTALGRAWRRFRRLPGPVQAAAAVAVLGAYTVALVALVGGGDGGSETKQPLSALEREVKRNVELGRVPQTVDTDDVSGFRTPQVASSRCDGETCKVAYTIAVPGRGRILIQQADIVRRVFGETDVARLELKLFRGQPRGPLASPKAVEETPLGVPLFETTCDRDKAPDDVDWTNVRRAAAAYSEMCTLRDVFKAPGQAGGAGGEE